MMTLAELEESGAYDGATFTATVPLPLFDMTTGLQVFLDEAGDRLGETHHRSFSWTQGLTEADRERMVRSLYHHYLIVHNNSCLSDEGPAEAVEEAVRLGGNVTVRGLSLSYDAHFALIDLAPWWEPEHGLVAVIDEGRITGVCDYQSDYREDVVDPDQAPELIDWAAHRSAADDLPYAEASWRDLSLSGYHAP
jgi:hypothetical protein